MVEGTYISKIMEIIEKQFLEIMQSDPEYWHKYKVILSNEQQFVKKSDRDAKSIYIVVKFLSGSLNFGQVAYPVNFNALGEGNKIEAAQRLLLEYAQTYNLGEDETWTDNGDRYIAKQIYMQPQVMSNFNAVASDFRTLFYMSGTFLIGKNSMPITKIEYFDSIPSSLDTEGQNIDFLLSAWDFTIQLDSQAFYGTNSRTKSKSKLGTLALSFTCYSIDNSLCNKIRGMAFNDATLAANGINEVFYFRISFASGYRSPLMEFHLSNASSPQTIGELPLVSFIFTN